jgi:hypothetical protein
MGMVGQTLPLLEKVKARIFPTSPKLESMAENSVYPIARTGDIMTAI